MSPSPHPDPNAPFIVPPGYRLLDSDSVLDDDKFDWDTIKQNPNLELWLIRIPNNLSAKHLESVTLSPSSSLHPSKLGELTRKETTYDIWSQSPFQSNANGDEALQRPMCGEEMKSITCLLPRRSKGGLYAAPRPITRHVIITTKPDQPQPVTDPTSCASTSIQNPPRQSYPPNLLKHRFMPYGSLAPINGAEQDHEHRKLGTSKPKNKNKSSNQNATSAGVHMDIKPAPPNSARKGAKGMKEEQGERRERDSLDVDASSAPHPVNLPAAEGGKSKKRKGDKEGVKKSKKLKTRDT